MADKKKKPSKHSMGMRWEIEKYLQDINIPVPHLFLASIMAGIDPRPDKSQIFELVKEMAAEEDLDGKPDADAWEALKLLVFNEYQKESVVLGDSIGASKELLQYMYPKKKAIEVTGEMGHLVKVVPLTKEEVDTFEKRFVEDFDL
jgi:hypothetical protein